MSMIRLDKIGGKNHLVSFTSATDTAQGCLMALGSLNADGDSYTATAVTDVAKDRIVLHASVPLVYDSFKDEQDYVLPKGKVGRGYILNVGDIITVTSDLITGTPVLNGFAIPEATKSTYKFSATVATEKLAFQLIEKTSLFGVEAWALEVVKAI